MAIIVSIMAATIPLANRNRASADYTNKAVAIAQKELEAVKMLGFPNITSAQLFASGLLDSASAGANGMYPFTNIDTAAFDAPAQVLPSGLGFVGLTNVNGDLKRVTVRVEWVERGVNRNVTIGTYVANL